MTQPGSAELYRQLTDILRDVFDNDTLAATPELTASMVDGWDSMGNVHFFLAIEQQFGVRFRAAEISDIQNLEELVVALARKL